MDILLQRGLLEIQNDYKRLISTLDELQVKPVIFTIPVRRIESDDSVGKQLHQKLLLFNAFLLDTFRDSHIVIDLWQATKVEPSEQYVSFEIIIVQWCKDNELSLFFFA